MSFFRRHKKKLVVAAVVLGAPLLAHGAILLSTRMTPPAVHTPLAAMHPHASTRVREGLREVFLEGDAEQIGVEHATLLRQQMVSDEGEVWSDFTRFVPFAPARALLMDLGRFRYRAIDDGVPDARRRELAAQALAFQPDPFADRMATYQRFVFLYGLYDIALGFEHSPLLGCSAFVLGGDTTTDGHTLVGRAFDFEVNDIFDSDKAVFLVHENGAIPFASVAWPGLLGVLTGMNAEGVFVSVNGGRAGEPRTVGEPVVFALRDVLEKAHDTNEALEILRKQEILVSHIVLVVDAAGHAAVVERAPGRETFVKSGTTLAVTNHFEGPMKDDPKNLAVREKSTTVARRARLDELVAAAASAPRSATPASAVGMLRDHACASGMRCELGDRRAVDALIATHGVVADTTARTIWVSASPHLSGRFVKIDLRAELAADHDPAKDPPAETIAEDPILHDGRYAAGRAHAGGPRFGGDK